MTLVEKIDRAISWNDMTNALDGKWRENLSLSETRAWVDKCFLIYEHHGFAKTFKPCYSDYKEMDGMNFTVVRRANTDDVDMEQLPMWLIKFDNGKETFAFPEEIALDERKIA